MSDLEVFGLCKRDTDALLDIVASGSRLSFPDDPPTCTNCGDLLSDPNIDRAVVVIHDGWTYAVHEDCLDDVDLLGVELDATTVCRHCDRIIHHYGRARHRTYCSATCKNRARWQREHLDERELRECAGCGEVFEQRRTDQEVCSARCRQRIHRQRSRLHRPNSWTAAVTS